MATQTQTTAPSGTEHALTGKEKVQQLRELFADAPEMAKTALENALTELMSQAAEAQASRWKAPAGPASVRVRSRS